MRRILFFLSLAVLAGVLSTPVFAQELSRHIETWYFDATTGEHTGTWIQGCGQRVGDPSSFSGVTWKNAGWATYTSMVVERWPCEPAIPYQSNFTWQNISNYCQIQTVETWDGYYVCDPSNPLCGYSVSTNQVCKWPTGPV